MITKIHAHIAAAYDYKLVDEFGDHYKITRVSETWIDCESDSCRVTLVYEDIGDKWHILARPLSDLVKPARQGQFGAYYSEYPDEMIAETRHKNISVECQEKLYEMHFDLFPDGTTKPITI